MHFIPLSILAAALMAAAAPSPERAEITLKIDLTSDDNDAGNLRAPLESPGLDATESHGGDGPNLSDWQFNLHYNFSLSAVVTGSPKFPRAGCGRPDPIPFLVGYRPGVPYAEFGPDKSNFTLCRGHLLYDNSVFTVSPPQKPVYISLGPSERASIFQTEKRKDGLYIIFNDPKTSFASLDCPPRLGARLAAVSAPATGSLFILFPFFSLSLSLTPSPISKGYY